LIELKSVDYVPQVMMQDIITNTNHILEFKNTTLNILQVYLDALAKTEIVIENHVCYIC